MTGASAQSPQPLPPVNLGFTSFVDGAPPAGPGLYFAQYVQYYGARRFRGADGNVLPLPDPQLDVVASLTQFIYMWDCDLPIGAKPALDVLIPVIGIDLDLAAPVPGLTADNGGLGDILIGPALQFDPVMGCDGPLFVHRLEAQLVLPTGEYHRDRLINAGSNFFQFNPYWAGTLFLDEKTTASFRAHYLWNSKNEDPLSIVGPGVDSTQAGEAFHINFTASREILPKQLRVGVNGYWLKQTTDAKIDGVAVPDTREQVFGIGPGCLVSFSQEQHFFCNLYWESEARNRPEGFRVSFRYVHKF